MKASMNTRCLALIGVFCIGLILAPLAVAQQEIYRPPLGDMMSAIQARHIKLWFAGKFGNWDLAAYEVGEIRANLENAANLYRGYSRGARDQYRRSHRGDP